MALSRSLSKDNSNPSPTDLPVLRRKRTIAFNRLRKVLEVAVAAKTDSSRLGELLVYYSSIQKHVDYFEHAHLDILSIVNDEEAEREDILRSEFDKVYYQVLTIHHALVSPPTSATSTVQPKSAVRLPKLDLPKFSGSIKEWSMFYDAFNSLIHLNEALSDSDRMQYLRASLFGDALGLIRTFPIQGAYYQEAYQTLINRYRDKRELAFTCWREMLNITLKMNSPTEFRRVLDLFNENLLILKGLKLPTDEWDFILCYHLLSKLDSKTRCAFEKDHPSSELPSYSALKEFLESQCEALVRDTHFSSNRDSQPSTSSSIKNAVKSTNNNNNKKNMSSLLSDSEKTTGQPEQSKSTSTASAATAVPGTTSNKCSFCSELHSIAHCKSFASKTVQERHDHAKQNRWCFNCLKPSHTLRDCRSVFSCLKCRQKHHTLLHQDSNANSSERKDPACAPVRALTNIGENSVVLLSTAVIQIRDSSGCYQSFRAIIDTGSQAHFISERAVNRLGLDKHVTSRQVRGVGQASASISGTVQLQIGIKGQVAFNLDALTIPNICGNMPSVKLNKSSWLHIRGLNFADPDWDKPAPIDVLLGAEVFPSLILPGSVSGGPKQPTALNSVFGWLLIGSVADNQADDNINSFFVSDDQLFQEVKKFWELDNLPDATVLTAADKRCEQIYRDTTTRDNSGRYCVALPFKDDVLPSFPGSRGSALRRFHSLERKLSSDSVVQQQYSSFMAEYLQLGHMSRVPTNEVCQGKYYIPHHCVLRPDSVSTKLRVVFDASNRDAIAGVSLNETLLIGPKLQANILEILLKFRVHSIVFSADVCKMYRQLLIKDEHRDYQRIFWRFHPSQPIEEYRLNTVTYGVSSAPFLACRTIKQIADDEGGDLPFGKAILKQDVFVDDVVTGSSDLEQAIRIKTELIEILKCGGMELRKWASNVPSLLEDLPSEHCLTENVSMDVEKSDILKILRLKWEPRSDNFLFEVKPLDRVCTKRNILSELARIYDPIGFLSPLTFFAKYLVQRLWILGVGWDEDPPEEIKMQWSRYIEELPLIQNLKIPRHLASSQIKSCELHGFADSSMRGFGAVVYLRVRDLHDNIKVFFVMSKARVAPIKVVSLPRLELCAAVLAADLLKFVKEIYQSLIPISDFFAWSDSTVTLAWIRSPSSRWKTFVANRVSHIQDAIPGARWLKVPTAENPGDIPSRGQTPAELINNSLWWAGPGWLSEDVQSWPCSTSNLSEEELCSEEKVQILLTNDEPSHPIDDLLIRFSSVRKIQRIVGLCLRFSYNLRCKLNRRSDPHLNRAELHNALLVIVKHTQFLNFQEDMKRLKESKVLSKPMRKLTPFIDSQGILRVGGRLSRSGLEYTHKHSALLPRQAPLTYMIIDAFHRENCHPGINTLHYLVSQQFWILSAKRAIRHQVSKCLRCFKTYPTPLEPFMSDLPAVRVNQVKPFSIVGVDYAGPFRVKAGKHRGAKISKVYLVLFVCLSTKCVFLDVATDLTSEAFIAALRRFVGRRGRVSVIYSDRGTNFVGAQRELSLYMQDAARSEGITFRMNPPASPHWGGIWEVQVKATKSLLYRIVGTQSLTLEELFTLFVQIESVLNSRPLYPLSSDPNDFAVLTPGHFLTLEPLTTVPDEDLTSVNITRLKRWQLIQRFQQDFWKRWKNEYLQSLIQRAKWTKHSKPLDIGSVVIIKSETPPLQWPIARVERLHAGPDGVIRVATLRLPNGSFLTRPLVKICPLPNQTD